MSWFKRKKEIIIDETDNILNTERALAQPGEDPAKERRELTRDTREYLDESRQFHRSEIERSKRSEKTAWRLVCALLVITIMSVGAVMGLTPLKELVPYTIRVNDNSGFTDIVYPKGYGQQSMTKIDDQFWLTTYVRARESYNWYSVSAMFKYVSLLSSASVGEGYKSYMLSEVSPVKVLADKRQIEVVVSPPTYINGAAQVRFTKKVIDREGKETDIKPTSWIALITFDYQKPITTKKDEMDSPHGFQVTSYKVDQEFHTPTTN
ncbi:type IV secretion system protein [Salmonella enterica]